MNAKHFTELLLIHALFPFIVQVKKRVGWEHRSLGLRGHAFVTHRVTQLYPEGACVYFYLAIYAEVRLLLKRWSCSDHDRLCEGVYLWVIGMPRPVECLPGLHLKYCRRSTVEAEGYVMVSAVYVVIMRVRTLYHTQQNDAGTRAIVNPAPSTMGERYC